MPSLRLMCFESQGRRYCKSIKTLMWAQLNIESGPEQKQCGWWEWVLRGNVFRVGICLQRRFMTWGQTELHQYGWHNANAVTRNSYAQGRPGARERELTQTVLPCTVAEGNTNRRKCKKFAFRQLWRQEVLCPPGYVICIEKWLLPFSLSYGSLGLIGTDRLRGTG